MAKEEESASISLPQNPEEAGDSQAHIALPVETERRTAQTKPSANEQSVAADFVWATPRDINRDLAARIAEGREFTWVVLGIPDEAVLQDADVTPEQFLAQLDVFNKRLLAREKVAAQIKQLRADYPRYKQWLDELQALRNAPDPWAAFLERARAEHRKRQYDELVLEARVHLKDKRLDWAEHQKMLASAKTAGLTEADVEQAYLEVAGPDFERETAEPLFDREHDEIIRVATLSVDVEALGQEYRDRADGKLLMLALRRRLSVGDEVRFVVLLLDGTPAFAGAGRSIRVTDQGREAGAGRYETLIDALAFDEQSAPVYEYIVQARQFAHKENGEEEEELAPKRGLQVDLDHLPVVNLAIAQSAVPVISELRITNRGAQPSGPVELTVQLRPDLVDPYTKSIASIRPGETTDVPPLGLLRSERLRTLVDPERAELLWELRASGSLISSGRSEIEVLASNEWTGLGAPPALLACFVTPENHAVDELLADVQKRLLQCIGDSSTGGGHTYSPARVREIVLALYASIQSIGIAERVTSANSTILGQKIQLAEALLRERQGTSLDLSILVASCLERLGIFPLIVIESYRAFCGAWLSQDRFSEGIVYGPSRLQVTASLGQTIFFDASAMLETQNLTFEDAEKIAYAKLEGNEITFGLDVMAVRDRYQPLSSSGQASGPILHVQGAGAAARAIESSARAFDHKQPQAIAKAAPLNERFKTWREKLLDLSLRNKLMNFTLEGKGALALSVPDIARFEDLLAADHTFEIRPRSKKRLEQSAVLENLNSDVLQSALEDTGLARQATQLKRAADAAVDEGGANVLYVALGFLMWFENDSSDTKRLAPLLLVPVALDYARATQKIHLRRLPEETLPNWTLVEKMRADFGVDLDALGAIEADESGLDVPGMLEMVRQRIATMKRWQVLEDAHVGVFSFTKYLMWRDLGDNQDVLLENRVIRHIATKPTDGFHIANPDIVPERMDDVVTPGKLPLVVDSDSTQSAAVMSAICGQSFVLQGPPGTGKSQTITNLIAAALASEKSVLFVSEKMAALEVVYRRLQSVGLADFCLELHSHKAQKRDVIQSLGRTLERSERTKSARWDEDSAEIATMRDQLNVYARALHAPTALGSTLHEVSARLLTMQNVPLVRLRRASPEKLTSEQLTHTAELATSFGLAASRLKSIAMSPFQGCLIESWSGQLERDTQDALVRTLQALEHLDSARGTLCGELRLEGVVTIRALEELAQLTQVIASGPVPRSWLSDDEWKTLREHVHVWSDALTTQKRRRSELELRWRPAFYQTELVELEALFKRWAGAFFLFAWFYLFGARRRLATMATSTLPGNHQISADLPRARAVNEAEPVIENARIVLQRVFEGCGPIESVEHFEAIIARGNRLREAMREIVSLRGLDLEHVIALADPEVVESEGARLTDHAKQVLNAIGAYQEALVTLRGLLAVDAKTFGPQESQHLVQARVRLESWQQHMGSYRDWCMYQAARRALDAAGCSAIVEALEQGVILDAQCAAVCERALLDEWVVGTRDANPALRTFDGARHHALVERFRQADTKHIGAARQRVLSLLEARLPPRTGDAGEPGILRREMAKKRSHMPLRKLLQAIPNLLPRLKPCLLMSPLSVAQYLPARGRRFDLVVFDEASQICTHDAIGAIGRGNQLVVVGDSKQLPPTAFFARAASEQTAIDENDFTELESVLDEARASGMPEQMLGWHYRSRHETLIEFSNQHYYESRLNVFPAARGAVADLGIKFHLVPNGVYELGKSRTNPREARALVDLLVDELRHTAATARTFGVVTFSSVQQELIEDLLEEARKKYPEIEPHFAEQHPSFERVFVKNLENVQGDERDEILFSIAYAPDEKGKMLMNFGPVNRDGGERRLNVAATRARKQLRVFSSITADQIDTNRTRSTGARHLKSFLRFAAERSTSKQERTVERGGTFDSQFEREIYDVLREDGYEVDTQVGCGSYRIDLAVFHPKMPGVYALGIECDGAAYHSAATARDRDRLRQQILEGLGWRLHRIWSTDWIYRRNEEVQRLRAAVEHACKREVIRSPAPPPVLPQPASAAQPASAPPVQGPASPVVPYQRAQLRGVSSDPNDFYEDSNQSLLQQMVLLVLRAEAPIHLDELTRRVGEAFNLQRITARPRRRMLEIVNMTRGYSLHGEFIWDNLGSRNFEMPVRAGEDRAVDMIPVEEVAAAARWVLVQALSITEEELVRETVRVFGIQRRGAKVEARMRLGVELLLRSPQCKRDGEHVTWRG